MPYIPRGKWVVGEKNKVLESEFAWMRGLWNPVNVTFAAMDYA